MSEVSATPGDEGSTASNPLAPTFIAPAVTQPVDRHGNPVRDIENLVVPGVGRVELLNSHPWAVVYDREGTEVSRLSLALRLLQKSSKTNIAYAKSSLRLCRFLWAIDSSLEEMTRRDYRDYRRWLSRCHQLPSTMRPPTRHDPKRATDVTAHLSASTVAQSEAAARTLFRALEDHDIIDVSPIPPAAGTLALRGTNPLDRARRYHRDPRETTKSLKGIGPIARQVNKYPVPLPEPVREHLVSDPCPRGAALWRFMVESGPRINEVLTLQPERMFLDENYVEVLGKGLGGETRWVPVSDQTIILFRRYQDFLASRGVHLMRGEPVWRSTRVPFAPISYEGIRASLARRTAIVTDREYTPHMLRHTAATNMLTELGMDITYVQRVLGHALLSSTQKYLHADLVLATQQFAEAWRRGRTAPAIDLEDLYSEQLLKEFFGAIDD